MGRECGGGVGAGNAMEQRARESVFGAGAVNCRTHPVIQAAAGGIRGAKTETPGPGASERHCSSAAGRRRVHFCLLDGVCVRVCVYVCMGEMGENFS